MMGLDVSHVQKTNLHWMDNVLTALMDNFQIPTELDVRDKFQIIFMYKYFKVFNISHAIYINPSDRQGNQ